MPALNKILVATSWVFFMLASIALAGESGREVLAANYFKLIEALALCVVGILTAIVAYRSKSAKIWKENFEALETSFVQLNQKLQATNEQANFERVKRVALENTVQELKKHTDLTPLLQKLEEHSSKSSEAVDFIISLKPIVEKYLISSISKREEEKYLIPSLDQRQEEEK